MDHQQAWFIIKTEGGHCQIIGTDTTKPPEKEKVWGPFETQEKAIAARIGLIRSGKCQPQ